jgi:hypothetical protein
MFAVEYRPPRLCCSYRPRADNYVGIDNCLRATKRGNIRLTLSSQHEIPVSRHCLRRLPFFLLSCARTPLIFGVHIARGCTRHTGGQVWSARIEDKDRRTFRGVSNPNKKHSISVHSRNADDLFRNACPISQNFDAFLACKMPKL